MPHESLTVFSCRVVTGSGWKNQQPVVGRRGSSEETFKLSFGRNRPPNKGGNEVAGNVGGWGKGSREQEKGRGGENGKEQNPRRRQEGVFPMVAGTPYSCSSPKSCLTLEKSKSSPVPRRKMSSTSRQVVSKWVVASYDSEMNT